jgi:hypothetical protein
MQIHDLLHKTFKSNKWPILKYRPILQQYEACEYCAVFSIRLTLANLIGFREMSERAIGQLFDLIGSECNHPSVGALATSTKGIVTGERGGHLYIGHTCTIVPVFSQFLPRVACKNKNVPFVL